MSNYFRQIPNFEYISRINERKSNNDYLTVKNLFRRGVIREDIFAHFMTFTKYKIIGDERPDEIAYKFYNDEDLDWVILAANNIVHVRDEWPLTQWNFHNYLMNKYGSEAHLDNIKHYETEEIKDTKGKIHVPKGKIVDADFSFTFLDSGTNRVTTVSPIKAITYRTYEEKLQDDKRNINILERRFLSQVIDEIETLLDYERSSEYINPKLKRGSNPNLG